MSTILTKAQKAMVRESARGLNGSTADTFEANVIARLDGMAATGVNITTVNVRTACAQQLAQGK